MKYVLDFYNHIDQLVIDQYLADNNITKIKQLESFGKVYLVESENEIIMNELIESLSADADHPVTLLSSTVDLVDSYIEATIDIEDEKNWWKVATINKINFDQPTHTHKIRGMNSTVYIIDSGITTEHPEFANANIELLHTFNGNFTDNNGHGTGLSSLIVGSTCGIANPCLKVVKLFDNTQPTYQSDMLIALDAVLNDFISGGKKSSVVNMSWAIPRNEYINAKIQYMIDQGIYVVVAAGNNGMPIGDVTPASIPAVLTIGSFNQNLEPSSFSNYTGGSDISYIANDVNYGALDGWAPGELIWAANKNGGYGYIAGTSAAAAITSAALAYNMNAVLDNSNKVNEKINIVDTYQFYSNLVLSRNGLLNLSAAQYAGSVNKIASIYNGEQTLPEFYSIFVVADSGIPRHIMVTNPIYASSISCDDLPAWATMDDKGYITVNYTLPSDTQYQLLPEIMFTIINRDGTTRYLKLDVAVTSTDLKELYNTTPSAITDDIIVRYVLNDDSFCTWDGVGCQDVNGCSTQFPVENPFCQGTKTENCFCGF